MFKRMIIFLLAVIFMFQPACDSRAEAVTFKLGSEQLMESYYHLIVGKRVGLVTNQSGVNSKGQRTIDVLAEDNNVRLVALYGPEHGIDGTAKAGEYVASYTHPTLGIPVYSLYGQTRKPTKEMLSGLDVLLFDIQDIGARTYTYISTLNYCMAAAKENNVPIVVLDRPNPLGGLIVEGPVLEDPYKSFVGVDNLPKAHGMTVGEIALFFNRLIDADLTIVPMQGYSRSMIWQDTGLTWVPTSPRIPDITSVFGYMATGLGEGTGIFQADDFKWIGGKGIDSRQFAGLLNQAGLAGVTFIPEDRGEAGGVRLNITNYRTFNPARTGIYALAYARQLNDFKVPKSGTTIVMFDKIMGTDKMGKYLEAKMSPQQIEANYAADLNRFKEERKKYLIYGETPGELIGPSRSIQVIVDGRQVVFDVAPYIDNSNRVMVPLRAIVESLGAAVDWEARTGTITISKNGEVSVFKIGSNRAVFNGREKIMDTMPVIRSDRTLVPARYVAESIGAGVHWDNATKTVIITSKTN